jgi:hypothetical protein
LYAQYHCNHAHIHVERVGQSWLQKAVKTKI